MDIIKLPYTSYLDLSVKDFSEFIQNELLKENAPKDSWYNDIGDNIYYYLERYFIKQDIKYDEDINEKLLDLLCESICEYWNWIRSLFPPTLSNEEVFDKWMPEVRAYTYRFLKLRDHKNNNPLDSGLKEVINDVAQYIIKLSLKS